MGRSWVGAVLAISSLCGLFASEALAHPASGIVVNANGEVFFIDTGHGVCKIDARGKLTYIHKVSGGGHFLALDTEGSSLPPPTPGCLRGLPLPASSRQYSSLAVARPSW